MTDGHGRVSGIFQLSKRVEEQAVTKFVVWDCLLSSSARDFILGVEKRKIRK